MRSLFDPNYILRYCERLCFAAHGQDAGFCCHDEQAGYDAMLSLFTPKIAPYPCAPLKWFDILRLSVARQFCTVIFELGYRFRLSLRTASKFVNAQLVLQWSRIMFLFQRPPIPSGSPPFISVGLTLKYLIIIFLTPFAIEISPPKSYSISGAV